MHDTSQARTDATVLWVRSLSPDDAGPRRSLAVERLQRLEAGDHLDEVTVRLWGKRIRKGTPEAFTERGETILARVERFQEWADSRDLSLAPFFEQRERAGRTEVRLPSMGLAEYGDGDLRFVSPCANAEVGYTVFDRIETLEAEAGATERVGATPDVPWEPRAVTEK